ncbi:hypothetical protein SPRA44_260037 [Serratia proteamaculans]|nr:hypothetical protein SPRA44_260037 [Serratia proteamaculans]
MKNISTEISDISIRISELIPRGVSSILQLICPCYFFEQQGRHHETACRGRMLLHSGRNR